MARRRSRRGPVPTEPIGLVGRELYVHGRFARIAWEAADRVGWAYSPDDYVHVVLVPLCPSSWSSAITPNR